MIYDWNYYFMSVACISALGVKHPVKRYLGIQVHWTAWT